MSTRANLPVNGLVLLLLLGLSGSPTWAATETIMMIGKRQVHNTTHTKVVFFHDRGITSMADCQREIQRGVRGQWRFYHHRFAPSHGYAWRTDYFCVHTTSRVNAWQANAPYDHVYQVDLRTSKLQIKKKANLNECLRDLRQHLPEENHRFFCARVSQTLQT